jgi:transcriptional regulator with GAF, ATPase, and Fis domain
VDMAIVIVPVLGWAATAAHAEDGERTALREWLTRNATFLAELYEEQKHAAPLVGLTRFQLYSRLKRYHIGVARGFGAERGWTTIRC